MALATRMRTSGSYWSSRLHATVASAASATSVRMFALVVASSARAGPVRATATTGAPASANARAIPRPRPRLAPTTTVVLSDKSLMVVLFLLRVHRVSPFAYDLTGSASAMAAYCSAMAAYCRSSALAAPLRQLLAMDCDMGSGKMSSSPSSTPS